MPISATGKRSGSSLNFSPAVPPSRGFTLLELMLVMLIMAVAAAFVIPNLFRPATADLDDSARLMVRILNLAGEEAELRGVPLRCNFAPDHYDFELAGANGVWQPLNDKPFGSHKLPEGVSIARVKLAEGVQAFLPGMPGLTGNPADAGKASGNDAAQGSDSGDKKNAKKPGLGSVTFQPDGMLDASDIRLHSAAGEANIELRPGPGGIRIVGSGS